MIVWEGAGQVFHSVAVGLPVNELAAFVWAHTWCAPGRLAWNNRRAPTVRFRIALLHAWEKCSDLSQKVVLAYACRNWLKTDDKSESLGA